MLDTFYTLARNTEIHWALQHPHSLRIGIFAIRLQGKSTVNRFELDHRNMRHILVKIQASNDSSLRQEKHPLQKKLSWKFAEIPEHFVLKSVRRIFLEIFVLIDGIDCRYFRHLTFQNAEIFPIFTKRWRNQSCLLIYIYILRLKELLSF